MRIEIEGFINQVSERYRVLGSDDSTRLVANGRPGKAKFVHPFSNEALFLEFSSLDGSVESVSGFVGEYGYLISPQGGGVLIEETGEYFPHEEYVVHWGTEIGQMRGCVHKYRVSRAFADGNIEYLENLGVELESKDPLYLNKVFRSASEELARMINNKLEDLRPDVLHQTAFNQEIGGLEYVLEPFTLLGGLWLQFLAAVVGNMEFRQCRACDKSFPISPDLNRSNRFFCSDSCRWKDHRGRKKLALELHRQGSTAEEIAERLSVGQLRKTTPKTVQGWIDKEADNA